MHMCALLWCFLLCFTRCVPVGQAALPARGGESAALARLQHYLWGSDAARTYFDTRNGMLGPDFSTKFSPWLAAGCASWGTYPHALARSYAFSAMWPHKWRLQQLSGRSRPMQQAFGRSGLVCHTGAVHFCPGVWLALLFCTLASGPCSADIHSDFHRCKSVNRVAAICRCLSARVIAKELKRYEAERADGGKKSTYWIVFELLWRDYFRSACGKAQGHACVLCCQGDKMDTASWHSKDMHAHCHAITLCTGTVQIRGSLSCMRGAEARQ